MEKPSLDTSAIKFGAYGIMNRIDELRSNRILMCTSDSDLNWFPDPDKTYWALHSLACDTRNFIHLVLSEIKKQEQLPEEKEDASNN